jgi:glycosyltransferase involved in cell wall biosynthesis
MTLSMLEGSGGNQKKEVERLVDWLAEHEQPDVVHISNALLIGLAGEIKARLDVPVACSLQDEDWWLDEINPPYDEECWEAIRARCGDVDRFVAVSNWFADKMSRQLLVPRDLIDVLHVGIDLTGYEQASLDFNPPVLGYLSRMNEALGLDKLVDAFIELKTVQGLENLKLKATGGAVGDDLKCVEKQKRKLADAGLGDDADFIEDFTREKRLAFLKTISVMCVPVEQGEAFGSFIIEAMAAGVPVVQPNAGAFPELIEATGGGLIYDDLVKDLKGLLLDRERTRALGAQGYEAVHESFSVESMARNMISVYRELVS